MRQHETELAFASDSIIAMDQVKDARPQQLLRRNSQFQGCREAAVLSYLRFVCVTSNLRRSVNEVRDQSLAAGLTFTALQSDFDCLVILDSIADLHQLTWLVITQGEVFATRQRCIFVGPGANL